MATLRTHSRSAVFWIATSLLVGCNCRRGGETPAYAGDAPVAVSSAAPSAKPTEVDTGAAPPTPTGPLRVEVPAGSPAEQLGALVHRALGGVAGPCWIVWGDYRGTSSRPIVFLGTDGRAVGHVPSSVTCPAADAADFVSNWGDDRIKKVGLAYFRDDHFEYKATSGTEAQLSGVLVVTPQGGLAADMLARLGDLKSWCLFAYLRAE